MKNCFLTFEGQCESEKSILSDGGNEVDLLSDRCVLDCLAYAIWRKQQFEGGQQKYEQFYEAHKVKMKIVIQFPKDLQKVCWIYFQYLIDECFTRYRESLVILVRPFDLENGTENTADNVRLTMNKKQCQDLNDIFIQIMEVCIMYCQTSMQNRETFWA